MEAISCWRFVVEIAIERERQNVRKIILPLVVCRRAHVFFLRYLCLLTHSGVQHILCCVFVLCFFVLCTLCCQFLLIVHFWMPLLYSLKFIHLSKANLRLLWIISILILTFILKWYILWEMLFMTKSTNIYLHIRTNTPSSN